MWRLSRHPCVWNTLSRTFAEYPEKNPLRSLSFPTCHVRVSRFYVILSELQWDAMSWYELHAAHRLFFLLLLLLHLLVLYPSPPHHTPPSTTSSRPHWSILILSEHCRASTASAGSQWAQPAQPDTSRIIQTPRAPSSARSQWVLPGLNRERRISVGIARISQTPRHCHILSHIMPLPYIPLHSPITWYHMIFHWGGAIPAVSPAPPLVFHGHSWARSSKRKGRGGGEQKCNFGPARS